MEGFRDMSPVAPKTEHPPPPPNTRRDRALLGPEDTPTSVAKQISDLTLRDRVGLSWWFGFGVAFLLLMTLLTSITWLFVRGIGIWGNQIPVGWGLAITNFVWWIGIGHAGTFISAILLLLRQNWRTSINRFAEAMTLFAVSCAALFPLIHLGRPQFFYYIIPYPNNMGLWPQFRSPLVWDFFAVATYGTVSLLFWYLGLIPDLARLRDRTRGIRRKVYGFFALGWLGSGTQWRHFNAVYLVLAGLATPLVISVHSIVGLDFAISIIPGWHSTVFPPFFVAGAIFSGFAMVATLIIPLRRFYKLENLITHAHLSNIGKVMLVTGLLVSFGYLSETFFAWYSATTAERQMMEFRLQGPVSDVYYPLLACNVLTIQLLWSRRIRTTPWMLWSVSMVVNVGMWLERYIIVITTLARDYLPSAWNEMEATFWDWSTFAGTIGLFLCLVFLFVRFVPVISIFEAQELAAHKRKEAKP